MATKTIYDYTLQDYSYNNIFILKNNIIDASFTIPPNDFLIIPKDFSNVIVNPGIVIDNCGTLINYGTIDISKNAGIRNNISCVMINEFSGTIINDSTNSANRNNGQFINRGYYKNGYYNDLSNTVFINSFGAVFKNKNGGIFDNYGILTNRSGALFDNYYNYLRDFGQINNQGKIIPDIIYIPPAPIVPQYNIIVAGTTHSLAIDSNESLWTWGVNSQGQLGDPFIDSSSNVPILVSTKDIPYRNEILWVSYDASASASLPNYTIDISFSIPTSSSVYLNEYADYRIANAASTSSFGSNFPKLSVTTSCNTYIIRKNAQFFLSLVFDVSNNIENGNFDYLYNTIVDISGYQLQSASTPIRISEIPYLQEIDFLSTYQLILPTDASGTNRTGDISGIVGYIHDNSDNMTFTFSNFAANAINLTPGTYDISNNTNSRSVVNPYNKYNNSTTSTVFDLSLSGQQIAVNINTQNQIQVGKGNLNYSIPVDITPNNPHAEVSWIDIAAGGNSSFGLSTESVNNLYVWGDNSGGHLGVNNSGITNIPRPIQIYYQNITKKWIAIESGVNHLLALDSSNILYSCGDGEFGQLGNNTYNDALGLTIVNDLSNTQTVAIGCGENHSLAVDINFNLWAFGNNSNGQLGLGPSASSTENTLQKVTNVNPNTNATWIKVAGGRNHSLGLQKDGTIYAWGDNTYGQLGIGSLDLSRNIPSKISSPALLWIDIAAGANCSFALSNTNQLYAWGSDASGQLGLGDPLGTDKNIPTPITGQYFNFCAGGTQSLAIKNNGILKSWGLNTSGQLGTGNNTTSLLPIDVSNINPLVY